VPACFADVWRFFRSPVSPQQPDRNKQVGGGLSFQVNRGRLYSGSPFDLNPEKRMPEFFNVALAYHVVSIEPHGGVWGGHEIEQCHAVFLPEDPRHLLETLVAFVNHGLRKNRLVTMAKYSKVNTINRFVVPGKNKLASGDVRPLLRRLQALPVALRSQLLVEFQLYPLFLRQIVPIGTHFLQRWIHDVQHLLVASRTVHFIKRVEHIADSKCRAGTIPATVLARVVLPLVGVAVSSHLCELHHLLFTSDRKIVSAEGLGLGQQKFCVVVANRCRSIYPNEVGCQRPVTKVTKYVSACYVCRGTLAHRIVVNIEHFPQWGSDSHLPGSTRQVCQSSDRRQRRGDHVP